MIVFAREVFVCRCSTAVPEGLSDPAAFGALAQRVAFRRGVERDLVLLDPAHHDDAHRAELRERLARDEHWMIGADGERILTYTWLHVRPRIVYPYLPGCLFEVAPDVGYGYDAWTPPDLRGGGLRRRAFVEELSILRSLGMRWEASFFVKHQLEGAQRSLARVGIAVEPLFRVRLGAGRTLSVEPLLDDGTVRPALDFGSAEPRPPG